MPTGQADDQSPSVTHHTARKGDQGEPDCLQSSAHPLRPNTSRFIPEFRLKLSTGPPCGVGPEQPRRHKSLLRTPWTSSPLPHLCLDHQINSSPASVRLVTTPKTLCQPRPDNSIAGKGNSNCASIPGRGCSFNRSLIAMNRYSGLFLECPIHGHEVHLSPFAYPPYVRSSYSVRHSYQQSDTARRNSRSRQPLPQTRSPRTARLSPRRSATPADRRVRPITFSTPAGRCPSASVNTRNC